MNLYSIPAHLPFLDCLAAGILAAARGHQPERLSRTTILLPPRRSARALRTARSRPRTAPQTQTYRQRKRAQQCGCNDGVAATANDATVAASPATDGS